MNPLEQHLFQVIFGYPSRYEEDNKLQNAIEDKRRATVKEAASIVLKWIEKASHDLYTSGVNDGVLAMKTADFNHIGSNPSTERWLKENGLKTPEV